MIVREKAMLEKLLLAVILTFCLNLFLGVRLPNTATDDSIYHVAETTFFSLLRLGQD